ncbi:acyl-CoA N-acyltransferase [Blastocladiella britannica]|nr:acyl-CoA N-acyltransferase [Blastocladiella britannica]
MARHDAFPAPTLRPIEERDLPAIWQMIYELAVFEKMEADVTCSVDDLRRSLFPSDADVLSGRAVRSARAVILERPRLADEPLPEGLTLPLSAVHPDHLVLGFCLYYFSYSTFLGQHNVYVEDLCIREPYRAFGYGTVLLHSVIKHAVEVHGARRVEWSVLNWNEPAIRFYEDKCGARPQSEWTVYRVAGERLDQYRGYVAPGSNALTGAAPAQK